MVAVTAGAEAASLANVSNRVAGEPEASMLYGEVKDHVQEREQGSRLIRRRLTGACRAKQLLAASELNERAVGAGPADKLERCHERLCIIFEIRHRPLAEQRDQDIE